MDTLHALLRAGRSSWKSIVLVLLFNGVLCLWLIVKPGTQAQFLAVDNIGQTIGLLLGSLLCFYGLGTMWRRNAFDKDASDTSIATRWVPILLGLGVLSEFIGQAIFTYYEQILHQSAPFPSWADAFYLSAYPFLLLGVLLIPTRPLSKAARSRILADGLMIMTAVVTFSWYFILGPTIQQGSDTLLAKFVGAAYPFSDLLLALCLLLLALRNSDPAMRPVVFLLSLALTIVIITDSIFDYQTLQNAYATGSLLDAGWPLGYMLAGLAVQIFCFSRNKQTPIAQGVSVQAQSRAVSSDIPSVWKSLLPYALVPAVCLLALYAFFNRAEGGAFEPGIYIGGAILIGLVLLRQIFAIRETVNSARRTQKLNEELHTAQRELRANNNELRATQEELQAKNTALADANMRLSALATTDPLTALPNHRSLVAAIDQELQRSRRYYRPCSLLFLDLDHFKALNDGYGHPAGDAVLQEFAETVRNTLRGMDTLGRWGGEEFLAILPETDREEAQAAAERVRAAIAAHVFKIGGGLRLTASIGIATYPFDSEEREGLIIAADQAMYGAKRLGRNQVRTADDQALFALDAEKAGTREEAALAGTVEAIASLVEARDNYTGQHTMRVAALTMQLALALGLDAAEAYMIGFAGRLHDVGKVAIPDAILQKPARLTDEEWTIMRTHPNVGADVVSHVPSLRTIAPIIRAHHERWDGGGYPDKLAGENIPLGARIIAVVDAYEAMTTDRPYQKARPMEKALAELRRCAGSQFDPNVVVALDRVLTARFAQPEATLVS